MAGSVNIQRSDQGPIDRFMEHEAPKFHPALGSRASVDHDGDDEMEGRSLKRDKKDSLPSSLEKLERTLINFKNTTHEPLEFNVYNCPWSDVAEQLESALRAQQDREKAMGAKYGKARDFLSKALKLVSPALECIPGEVGLSVLKGGLAVIFTIARLKIENSDKILSTFQNIPDLLLEAEEARQAHPGHGHFEQRLNNAIEDLYLKLVEGLKELIAIFTARRGGVNYFASSIKGSEIDAVKENIRACIGRVRGLDKRLRDQRVAQLQNDMNAQMQQIHRKLSNGSDLSAGYTSDVSEIVRSMSRDIKERASEASIVNLTSEIQEMKDMLRELANEGLFQFLEESLRQFKENRPMDAISQFDGAQLSPATDDTFESLVLSIGRNAKDSIRDIKLVLRKQGSIPRVAEQEARSLWQSTNFLSWLNSRGSDMLFVTSASAPSGRTSALSIVCASLAVQLLGEDYHPLSAHFFCGEHTKAEDELAGPEGMVCSLVVQLAVHLHSRGMLYVDADWPRQLMAQDQNQSQSQNQGLQTQSGSRLGILFHVFGELLIQLPEDSTLFFILDGVSHYETDEMLEVMRRLRDKAFDQAVVARVKFLLTGPRRSDDLVRGLGLEPQYQVVKLNRAAGGGGMLAPPVWTGRSVRRRGM